MTTRRRRVRLVEDDPAVEAALLGSWEAAGFEAMGAADARQALEVLARGRIDVVVADDQTLASPATRRLSGRAPSDGNPPAGVRTAGYPP